jgi:UDP-3-O-[3-hydroxymyristoyl] N-acetylglucosamine deacetylase
MHTHQQTTVAQPIWFHGFGVHSGELSAVELQPAPAGTGIIMRHASFPSSDLVIGKVIPANTMHATIIGNDRFKLSTVEHLMAAIRMMEIDNIIITVHGNEVPILDGSAFPFFQGIERGGITSLPLKRSYITVQETLVLSDEHGRSLSIEPPHTISSGEFSHDLSIMYTAHFDHPFLKTSTFEAVITPEFFGSQVAPARTFGLISQLPELRKYGLAKGTTLGNTLVVLENGFLNRPRFDDEYVRHKVLDLIGDLALLGLPFIGRVVATKSGHNFNRKVVEHYIQHPEKWVIL